VTTSAALNDQSRHRSIADMTDNVMSSTVAFFRRTTSVTSTIKLSRSALLQAARCFSRCRALVDTRSLSRHASTVLSLRQFC